MIWKRAARHPKPLGGAGQIVEIDETVLASSKARQHIRIAVSVNNGANVVLALVERGGHRER
jgi:hypothetical protein